MPPDAWKGKTNNTISGLKKKPKTNAGEYGHPSGMTSYVDEQTIGKITPTDKLQNDKHSERRSYWKNKFENDRKHNSGNFRFLSRKVFLDPRYRQLTGAGKEVYLYALSQVNWNSQPRNKDRHVKKQRKPDCDVMLPVYALEELGISRSQRSRAIKELTGAGLLERVTKSSDGRNSSKLYRVTLI